MEGANLFLAQEFLKERNQTKTLILLRHEEPIKEGNNLGSFDGRDLGRKLIKGGEEQA